MKSQDGGTKEITWDIFHGAKSTDILIHLILISLHSAHSLMVRDPADDRYTRALQLFNLGFCDSRV